VILKSLRRIYCSP